jgi:hypothetical protein
MVREFEASGLRRREFCARAGLPLGTLDLYRQRLRREQAGETAKPGGGKEKARWVKVEAAPPASAGAAAIRVMCGEGVRIEVLPGFDARTLRQVVELLRGK